MGFTSEIYTEKTIVLKLSEVFDTVRIDFYKVDGESYFVKLYLQTEWEMITLKLYGYKHGKLWYFNVAALEKYTKQGEIFGFIRV